MAECGETHSQAGLFQNILIQLMHYFSSIRRDMAALSKALSDFRSTLEANDQLFKMAKVNKRAFRHASYSSNSQTVSCEKTVNVPGGIH